jgi:PAS domain S-box-containing protein
VNTSQRETKQFFFDSRLARKQLKFILIFSAIITLIGTSVQLFIEYKSDINYVDQQLIQVQTSHLRSLNNSLWNLDDEQLRIQLNNIVSMRDIIFIEIAYNNKVLFSAGEPIVDQQIISEKYEMTYNNGHIVENIGTLSVYASLTHIYERLFHRMFIILITQGLKTLLVALFILFIIHRQVIRYLLKISHYAQQFGLQKLDDRLEIERETKGENDELDLLANAINDMRQRLLDDVQIQQQTQNALRESEEKYRSLFKAAPDAILLVDATSMQIIDTNDTALRLYGYQREELLSLPFNSLPQKEFKTISLLEEISEDQVITITREDHQRKDGTTFPVNLSISFFQFEGRRAMCIAIRDITVLVRAEEELKKFRTVSDKAVHGNLITDLEGNFTYVNKRYARVHGYSPEELIGEHLSICHNDEQINAVSKIFSDMIFSGSFSPTEVWHHHRDGTDFPMLMSGVMITADNGTPKYMAATAIDIRAHKIIEKEKNLLQSRLSSARSLEAIGRLAGGVAHDFNNTLGIILGYTESALESISVNDPLRQDLQQIHQAAEHSLNLTTSLLALASKQPITPKPLDLNGAIEVKLETLRQIIGTKMSLNWLPSESLCSVLMDPLQIDQILVSLCNNAREACDSRSSGKITIETGLATFTSEYCMDYPGYEPGEYVLLAVSDNGNGMDTATREQIFEPFFTTKEAATGTGLGLSLTYGIVRQNNGLIHVYSEQEFGTTFRLYFPRHSLTAPQPALSVNAANTSHKQYSDETILLVENELQYLTITTRMLEKAGYSVYALEIPAEAISLFRTIPDSIQLLITDVAMPEINGRDLASCLQAMNPELKCLFMSGYTDKVIEEHGMLKKGVQFIQKPFSSDALIQKVRQVLDEEQIVLIEPQII